MNLELSVRQLNYHKTASWNPLKSHVIFAGEITAFSRFPLIRPQGGRVARGTLAMKALAVVHRPGSSQLFSPID